MTTLQLANYLLNFPEETEIELFDPDGLYVNDLTQDSLREINNKLVIISTGNQWDMRSEVDYWNATTMNRLIKDTKV